MAAGDHDAGTALGHRARYERRRRDLPSILHAAAGVGDSPGDRDEESIGARPQVAGQDHAAAGRDVACRQEVPEPAFDVDVRLEVRDVFDKASKATGPEGEGYGRIVEKRGGLAAHGSSGWRERETMSKSPEW
jgi:hypothetical protein